MKLLNFHKTVCVCVSVYVHVCACVCASVSMSVYPCSATGTSIMQIKCSIIQLHPRPHNSLSPLLMHCSVLAQPLTTKLLCFLSPPPHSWEQTSSYSPGIILQVQMVLRVWPLNHRTFSLRYRDISSWRKSWSHRIRKVILMFSAFLPEEFS